MQDQIDEDELDAECEESFILGSASFSARQSPKHPQEMRRIFQC